MLERLVLLSWYGRWQWTWLLLPFAFLYQFIVYRKRREYLNQSPQACSVPVIVVGNITAGGTGKTPVVQSIVRFLQSRGYRPGIVTRGFGGDLQAFPHLVSAADNVSMVGDEPTLLFQSLNVPVVVDPDRSRGVAALLGKNVDVVISDDGLQHYKMHRDIEVCVVDAQRKLGNGQFIPVGPMRESKNRLRTVDFVLVNGDARKTTFFEGEPANGFKLAEVRWVNLHTGQGVSIAAFSRHIDVEQERSSAPTIALAGIGNPGRFFSAVNQQGIVTQNKTFPDHHDYCESELSGFHGQILMTQKDAVKIKPFANERMWYLEVQADLPADMLSQLNENLANIRAQKNG